ncbi:MAG: glycosyltransferase family 4 protein [Prevotella sp.]|jgi:glycosyltransferase involved in cell wall biosynthesis
MRVLIINTSERTGGAAVAANRLMDALNNNGVKAKMLVRDKTTDDIRVVKVPQRGMHWKFLWDRWWVFWHLHFQKEHLFEVDGAIAGSDVTKIREFKEADVIHLHWVNQGFLSMHTLNKIMNSGKPVVWTMHDLWPATAICHYARQCPNFKTACKHCPLLPGNGSEHDWANKIWRKKQKLLTAGTVNFVACSNWLATQARQSALLRRQQVSSIPNTINTHVYRPQPRQEARLAAGLPANKKIILFVSQRVTDERKGLTYFVKALNTLAEKYPDTKDRVAVAILGGHAEEVPSLPFETFPLGYVNNDIKLVNIYSSSDVFVLPSLEDNLPNTIMEALACGVPCVGFQTGGIPEMIDHQQNGYIAQYKNAEDLARGIRWVLDEADHDTLANNALRKAQTSYSEQSVAMKYIEVYNQAMAFKRCHL